VVGVVKARRTWKCREMPADQSNSNCWQWFLRRERS